MNSYIYTEKGGIHIFDLVQTRERLENACEFLTKIAAEGGNVIFIGTKRQASSCIAEEAGRCGAFFVNSRWLGGTLTNLSSIRSKTVRLQELEVGLADGTYNSYTKRERSLLRRELEKLQQSVGGIVGITNLPSAIFVIDPKKEQTAVTEAVKTGVPVVALTDSNCDPRSIDYVIPGNDDASSSISLITKTIASALASTSKDSSTKDVKANAVSEDMPKSTDVSLDSLKLSSRSINALKKAGIETLSRLKELTEEELGEIKGIGKKALVEIMTATKKV